MPAAPPGGTLTLAPDFTVSRMGYGAMQLAGPSDTSASATSRRRNSPKRSPSLRW